MQGVTEDYERQLWEELNKLVADAIPAELSEDDRADAVVSMLAGSQLEIAGLFRLVEEIASAESDGYLAGKLEERNPIAAARRRLRFRLAVVPQVREDE